MKAKITLALIGVLALLVPASASAHVTLQPEEAAAGGYTVLDVRDAPPSAWRTQPTLTPRWWGESRVRPRRAGALRRGLPARRPRIRDRLPGDETARVDLQRRASNQDGRRRTKAVSIPGGGSAKVTIKLNGKGRKILKRDGVLNATLHAFQKQKKGMAKVLTTKEVTFKAASK